MSKPAADEIPATPGAQRQLNELREEIHKGLRAMRIAGGLFLVALVLTGWQVKAAFDNIEKERRARIGASASINTFLCQRIDDVGNGVAALVRVSLRNSPPPSELSSAQRRGYQEFLNYAIQQERPPRCRELALKIATLTGADPEDIEIKRIRLHPAKSQDSPSDGPSTNP
jgi:hypothetical protein